MPQPRGWHAAAGIHLVIVSTVGKILASSSEAVGDSRMLGNWFHTLVVDFCLGNAMRQKRLAVDGKQLLARKVADNVHAKRLQRLVPDQQLCFLVQRRHVSVGTKRWTLGGGEVVNKASLLSHR